ncbi:MAG TPA: hypothetical protein DEP72_05490 [Clostridiales bacterium]|nr:MAG: hypothetical protein A2Y18_03075 [Clostridiales bacterium GWD2_32_19]HCC07595.1 hypothetical protein [Clostridiales bacterium]
MSENAIYGVDDGEGKGREKRKVFRLEFKTPLCVDLKILQLKDKIIETGITEVCAVNLSPIGLSFESKLSFPVKSEVIYNLKTKILGETLNFTGIILWKKAYPNDIHRYGVKFLLDAEEIKKYIQLFNKFSMMQRKSKEPLQSCSYCKYDHFPCK